MKTRITIILLGFVWLLTTGGCGPIATPVPTATSTPFPTDTPVPTAMSTPIPTSTPTDIVPITSAGWFIVKDGKGSSISIDVVPGRTDNGLEISYTLKTGGWGLISRNISPNILSEIKGIRFFHKGSGAPNTIEFKLVYEIGTVFFVLLPGATVTDDWVLEEVQYDAFRCWTSTPDCLGDSQRLEPEKVTKMEFAIANKPDLSDEPGSGKVIIDDVHGIQP